MPPDIRTLMQQADESMRLNDAERLAEIASQLIAESSVSSIGKGLYFRGVSERMRGNLEDALRTFDEAADVIRNAGDHFALGDVEMSVGLVHWMSGDLPRALAHLEHALDIQRLYTPDRNEAAILGNIGLVHKDMGDLKEAIRWFHMAIEDAQRHGLRAAEATARLNIGLIYAEAGDHEEAASILLTVRAMFEELGNTRALLHVDMQRAIGLAESGDLAGGTAMLREVLQRALTIGDRHVVPQVLFALATTAQRLSQHAEVLDLLDQLDEYRPLPGAIVIEAALLRGVIAQERGDHETAQTLMYEALETADAVQNRTLQLRLHQALVRSAKELAMFEEYVRHSEATTRLENEVRGADVQRTLTLERHRQESETRRQEIERHRKVLYSTLPPHVADRVLRGEDVQDSFDQVSVIFMDLAGFTTLSSAMTPEAVVQLLNEIFTGCDAIVVEHGLMKIKTIGDSYMCASFDEASAVPAARTACAVAAMMRSRFPTIGFRIGIHRGPVFAGVIGTERLQYDVWGDTVNVASRMESHGEPGRIHVSEAFASCLRGGEDGSRTAHRSPLTDSMTLVKRGVIDVKGKGPMTTYWLT